MSDFSPIENKEPQSMNRMAITIWVPDNYKARYDKLQASSSRRFGKKLRELVQGAIDKVDQADA